jgi:hypothetical protein
MEDHDERTVSSTARMALHPGTASLNELEALVRVTPGLAFA